MLYAVNSVQNQLYVKLMQHVTKGFATIILIFQFEILFLIVTMYLGILAPNGSMGSQYLENGILVLCHILS